MFDLSPSFNFNFNISKLFSKKDNKHELQYQNFLKSIQNLENDNIIDLLCLKLLNGKFDLLILIKTNNNVIKMIGDFNTDIIQKFKMVRIPIVKSGKVKYTLILAITDKTKYKLRYDFIELLASYLD